MSKSEGKRYVVILTKQFERENGEKRNQTFGHLRDNDMDVLKSLKLLVRKPNPHYRKKRKHFLASPLVFFESYQIELKGE